MLQDLCMNISQITVIKPYPDKWYTNELLLYRSLLNLPHFQATKSSLFRVLILKKAFSCQLWGWTLSTCRRWCLFSETFPTSRGRLKFSRDLMPACRCWHSPRLLELTPGLLTQLLSTIIFQHGRITQQAYCTLIKYFSHLSAVTDFPIFLISFKWSSTNSFGTAVLRERKRKIQKEVKSGANILQC